MNGINSGSDVAEPQFLKKNQRIIEVQKYSCQIHPIHSRTNSLAAQKAKMKKYQLSSMSEKPESKCQIRMNIRTQTTETQQHRRKKIYFQTLDQLKKAKQKLALKHKTSASTGNHSSHSMQNNSQQEDTIHKRDQARKDRVNTALSQFKQSGGVKLKKKKKNVEKDFFTDNCSQNSIQYQQNIPPGPADYQSIKPKIHQPGPFSKSRRFERIRPLTALVGYGNTMQIKKKVNNMLQNVSFGTSKKNPRSQVKKVQFCEWVRPYFYQKMGDMNSKGRSQEFCLYFSEQRFKQEKRNYFGPDFYDKKKKTEDEDIPSYYFRSSIPKSGTYIDNDEKYKFIYPEVYISSRKQAKEIRKVGSRRMNKRMQRNEGEKGFLEQMSLENIKNSLEDKQRKLNFKQLNKRKQIHKEAKKSVAGRMNQEINQIN